MYALKIEAAELQDSPVDRYHGSGSSSYPHGPAEVLSEGQSHDSDFLTRVWHTVPVATANSQSEVYLRNG